MGFYNPNWTNGGPRTPKDIACRTDITSSDKLVYGALAGHCGPSGKVYPSRETLAKELGLSVRSIDECLKHLRDANLIQIDRPKGKYSLMHMHNSYRFIKWENFDGMANVVDEQSESPESHPDVTLQSRHNVTPIKPLSIKENTMSDTDASDGQRAVDDLKWKRFAQQLEDAISSIRKVNYKSKVPSWAKAFHATHKIDGIEIKRINLALTWYCEQLPLRSGDKYFLVILSGAAFRQKFPQLELAMQRDRDERRNAAESNTIQPTNMDHGTGKKLKAVWNGQIIQG